MACAIGVGFELCSCTFTEDLFYPPPLNPAYFHNENNGGYPPAPAKFVQFETHNRDVVLKDSTEDEDVSTSREGDYSKANAPESPVSSPLAIPASADEFLKRYSR